MNQTDRHRERKPREKKLKVSLNWVMFHDITHNADNLTVNQLAAKHKIPRATVRKAQNREIMPHLTTQEEAFLYAGRTKPHLVLAELIRQSTVSALLPPAFSGDSAVPLHIEPRTGLEFGIVTVKKTDFSDGSIDKEK